MTTATPPQIIASTGPPRRRRTQPLFAGIGLLLCCGAMLSGVWLARFHHDESQWIYTTRFLALFEQGATASPEWGSYWLHTQPPVARYLLGLPLQLAGYDLLHLNEPWDTSLTFAQNEAQGNMPTPAQLSLARLGSALAACGAVLLLFWLGRQAGGWVAGLAAAGWLAGNFYARELLTRATGDGLLLTLLLWTLALTVPLLTALAAATDAAAAQRPWRRVAGLTLAVGVVLGLATAAKLTAVFALPALALTLPLDAGLRWVGSDRRVTAARLLRRRLVAAAAAILGVTAVALAVFVAVNPALWPQPVAGSVTLFTFRQEEMAQQMVAFPDVAIPTLPRRFQLALTRPLFLYSFGASVGQMVSGDAGGAQAARLPLDAVLVALGLLTALGSRLSLFWRRRTTAATLPATEPHRPSGPGLGVVGCTAVWTLVVYGGIALTIGMDWDRYYLPIIGLAAFWAGCGLAWLWAQVGRRRAQTSSNPAHRRAF